MPRPTRSPAAYSRPGRRLEIFCVYVGDQLGFYRALHEVAPRPRELAARAGTNELTPASGWSNRQPPATSPLTTPRRPPASGFTCRRATRRSWSIRRACSAGHDGPDCGRHGGTLNQLLEAFRTGDGVPYADYGRDLHEGQARVNRPALTHLLAQEWIAAMPDVAARLQADPPARIADIGMGQGWSSIALARAYPKARIDGFDLDEASVAAARENVRAAGVDDRVTMHVRDAGDPQLAGCVTSRLPWNASMTWPIRSRCSARCAVSSDRAGRS